MVWRTNQYGNRYPIFNKKIKLSKKEYGLVMHNINTHANEYQRKKEKYNIKEIGNYAYIYKYNDFSKIDFYGKIRIVGNEEKIKFVHEYIRGENEHGFF